MCGISYIHEDRHKTDKWKHLCGQQCTVKLHLHTDTSLSLCNTTWTGGHGMSRSVGWLAAIWSGREALTGRADGDCSRREGVICVHTPSPLAESFVTLLYACTTGIKNGEFDDKGWYLDGCPPLLSMCLLYVGIQNWMCGG
jgi:hypothetical protein